MASLKLWVDIMWQTHTRTQPFIVKFQSQALITRDVRNYANYDPRDAADLTRTRVVHSVIAWEEEEDNHGLQSISRVNLNTAAITAALHAAASLCSNFPGSGETWNERSVLGFIHLGFIVICHFKNIEFEFDKLCSQFLLPIIFGDKPWVGAAVRHKCQWESFTTRGPEKNCTASRAPGPPWEDLGIFHLTEEYHRI